MNILQLCFVSDLWHSRHNVISIDIKNGIDVLDLSDDIGKEFDLIVAAPPCDQFTHASAWMWDNYPEYFIRIARKCFDICLLSGAIWFYENPPGRIEKFLPALTKYRLLTWQSPDTNKEYVIYGNRIILNCNERYGSETKFPRSKRLRELWHPSLVRDIENSLI